MSYTEFAAPSSSGKRKQEEAEIFDESDAKRRKIQNAVEVVIINSLNQNTTNSILMCQKQMEYICGRVKQESDYARIGDRVYVIGIDNSLPEGIIGVNFKQNEALKNSLFTRNNTPHIWINHFNVAIEKPAKLSSVQFEIRPQQALSSRYKKELKFIEVSKLTQKVLEIFHRHVITLDQDLLLTFEPFQLLLKVKSMTPKEGTIQKFFGKVSQNTSITFSLYESGKITLVDRILSNDKFKANFKVFLSRKDMIDDHETNPVLINTSLLQQKFFETIGKTILVIGSKHKIPVSPTLSVKITLSEVTGEGRSFAFTDSRKSVLGFDFSDKPHLIFTPSEHIILTSDKCFKAQTVDVELISMENHPDQTPPYTPLKWIDTSELKQQLIALKKPVHENQTIALKIGDKKILLKILEAIDSENPAALKKNEGSVQWKLHSDTEIRFCQGKRFLHPLIDNTAPLELETVTFYIKPKLTRGRAPKIKLNENSLIEAIKKQVFTPMLAFTNFDILLSESKMEVQAQDLDFPSSSIEKPKYGRLGKISETTKIKLVNTSSDFEIVNSADLLDKDPIDKLEEYKLAALSEELKTIIRSIYIQRIYKDESHRLQVEIEKGLLLFGPPGNGKTKLAIALADILGCGEKSGRLKILAGTEVFEKWVGSSEANVRELFEEAKKDYELYKDKSELHVIIIDEIDALLPKRDAGNHRVDNKVVNQFLSCLDGAKPLPNLLIIATTNNMELIDPAALRFGRIGKHIEIKSPSLDGRKAIFSVHTKHLKLKDRLAPEVNFDSLAKATENFTGAEIAGVVSLAVEYTLERLYYLKIPPDQCETSEHKRVTKKDFEKAIEETKKKKGVTSDAKHMGLYT